MRLWLALVSWQQLILCRLRQRAGLLLCRSRRLQRVLLHRRSRRLLGSKQLWRLRRRPGPLVRLLLLVLPPGLLLASRLPAELLLLLVSLAVWHRRALQLVGAGLLSGDLQLWLQLAAWWLLSPGLCVRLRLTLMIPLALQLLLPPGLLLGIPLLQLRLLRRRSLRRRRTADPAKLGSSHCNVCTGETGALWLLPATCCAACS